MNRTKSHTFFQQFLIKLTVDCIFARNLANKTTAYTVKQNTKYKTPCEFAPPKHIYSTTLPTCTINGYRRMVGVTQSQQEQPTFIYTFLVMAFAPHEGPHTKAHYLFPAKFSQTKKKTVRTYDWFAKQ